jgi:hypothetical protein
MVQSGQGGGGGAGGRVKFFYFNWYDSSKYPFMSNQSSIIAKVNGAAGSDGSLA